MKKIILFCMLAFAAYVTHGQIITTFAGNGGTGTSGDGGPATSAHIQGPNGLAFDGVGNIYISAYYTHNIRKVSASGIITTIAGTGTPGYSGDGGPATSAQLNYPIQIARDTTGNIYIADKDNHRIRKISASGIITTFAGTGTPGFSGDGGPATAAKIYFPTTVYAAPNGDVYISDYTNYRIRKISPAGIITTIAGTGFAGSTGDGGPATSATINQVWGITSDSSGNIYFADASNHKVRKISSTGIISTIAGTGVAGYSGDGGMATSAQLNNPADVVIDNAGNIYISDQLNNRVRMVSPSGIITTVVGTGIAGFSGDGGLASLAQINSSNDIALSPSGELFICDDNNNRVRRVSSCASSITYHPKNDTVNIGATVTYTVTTTAASPTYRWQADQGLGFTNLANVWPYSGVTTSVLTISNASLFLDSTFYRCVINGETLCSDTSNKAILRVKNATGINLIGDDVISIYPNPVSDILHITLAVKAQARIQLMNELGQIINDQNNVDKAAQVIMQNLPAGLYLLKIQVEGQTLYKKVIKD